MIFFNKKIISLNEFKCEEKNPIYIENFRCVDDKKISKNNKIVIKQNDIIFPDYGDYYITTNFGSFKILILDTKIGIDYCAIKICEFISKNSLCENDDAKFFYYENVTPRHHPNFIDEILFKSQFPIKLLCNDLCKYSFFVLKKSGFNCKVVELNDHYMLDIFLPNLKRYVLFDVSFGVTFYPNKKLNFNEMLCSKDVYEKILKKEKVFFKMHKKNILLNYKNYILSFMKKLNLNYNNWNI